MPDKFIKMVSTFFYVGLLPGAPGSLASLIGVLLAFTLSRNTLLYIVVTVFVTALGFLVSGRMEAVLKEKDPSCIVIDEVAGVLIAFFLLPVNLSIMITAYFLFRAFDMFKIFPVDRFEKLEGSKGVMLDDIVAGLYTNLTMHAALRLTGGAS